MFYSSDALTHKQGTTYHTGESEHRSEEILSEEYFCRCVLCIWVDVGVGVMGLFSILEYMLVWVKRALLCIGVDVGVGVMGLFSVLGLMLVWGVR